MFGFNYTMYYIMWSTEAISLWGHQGYGKIVIDSYSIVINIYIFIQNNS